MQWVRPCNALLPTMPKGEVMKVVILRRPEVLARTGLSKSTLYALAAAGLFPKPVRLAARAVGWPEAEIDAWLAARKAERDAA